MKKSTFEIITRSGDKEVRHGYVHGAFGMYKTLYSKEWFATHLKTGSSLHMLTSKKLSDVKAAITILNDRYNWDGDDMYELAKLNGMSAQDFSIELRDFVIELRGFIKAKLPPTYAA